MRPLRFRLRTLMAAVAASALLMWGVMMATRSYGYYQLATDCSVQESGWRSTAARNRSWAKSGPKIADWYAQLAHNYRHAMWHPWIPAPPEPPLPEGWRAQPSD